VKYCLKLKEDKSFRYKERKVLLFGHKTLSELPSKEGINTLLETYPHASGFTGSETYIVTDKIIDKIYGAELGDHLAAVVNMPEEKDVSSANHLLILDSICDPGNMGTLLRTALALGCDGVFFLGRCCDPYNDKALRAAKGATFALPLMTGDIGMLTKILAAKKRKVYIADMKGGPYTHTPKGEDSALILSSEAHGARQELMNTYTPISIPMSGAMESLNVSIAGGILIAHLWGTP
jgi:TrmH family RNA methyltransferase